jgi:hypothetical protein
MTTAAASSSGTLILRPYQAEAVAAVYDHLRRRDDNPCVVNASAPAQPAPCAGRGANDGTAGQLPGCSYGLSIVASSFRSRLRWVPLYSPEVGTFCMPITTWSGLV